MHTTISFDFDFVPSQMGASGWNEAVPSPASVQVAVSSPTRSNPGSHVYVAVAPMSLPVIVTPPLAGARGLSHIGAGAVFNCILLLLSVTYLTCFGLRCLSLITAVL